MKYLQNNCKNDTLGILSKYSRRNCKLLAKSINNIYYYESKSDEVYNIEALNALKSFLNAYQQIRTDKNYNFGRSHLSYLINLNLLDRELRNKKYCKACNIIITLAFFEPIEQKRIYVNLIEILTRYLE